MADSRLAVPLAWQRYETVNPEHVAEIQAALRGATPDLAEVHGAIREALAKAAALARQEGLTEFAAWAETFSHPVATTPLADRTAIRKSTTAAVWNVCPVDADALSDDDLVRRLLARTFPIAKAARWAIYAAARAAFVSLPPSDPTRLEHAHWLAVLAWDLARRERL